MQTQKKRGEMEWEVEILDREWEYRTEIVNEEKTEMERWVDVCMWCTFSVAERKTKCLKCVHSFSLSR